MPGPWLVDPLNKITALKKFKQKKSANKGTSPVLNSEVQCANLGPEVGEIVGEPPLQLYSGHGQPSGQCRIQGQLISLSWYSNVQVNSHSFMFFSYLLNSPSKEKFQNTILNLWPDSSIGIAQTRSKQSHHTRE